MASIDALSGVAPQQAQAEFISTSKQAEQPARGEQVPQGSDQEMEGGIPQVYDNQRLAQEGHGNTSGPDMQHEIHQDSRGILDIATVVRSSHENEDQLSGTMQVEPQGSAPNSPLFFSDTEPTALQDLEIRVPPVQQRWDYLVFDTEYTVQVVVGEVVDRRQLRYEVIFEDGHTARVSQFSVTASFYSFAILYKLTSCLVLSLNFDHRDALSHAHLAQVIH